MKEKSLSLQTDRLSLQAIGDPDTEDLISILCNDEIKKTYMVPDFPAREDALRLSERIRQLSLLPDRFVYGIKLNGRLIGLINEVDRSDNAIEVGYVIHPDYQNRGYATEALRASVQELFRMGYTAVRAGIFEGNDASKRVIEKSGMHLINLTEEIEYRGQTHRCIYFEIRKDPTAG